MAIRTTHICDRCGSVILESRTHLDVESGPVRANGRKSIDLCEDVRLDYVSCSPFRVPIARLAAAQAAIRRRRAQ